MSFISEEGDRRVRMAHLAVVGSHKVNGVAEIHTDLMKSTIFAILTSIFPIRIVNKTNGITPRRWLHMANPGSSQLIRAVSARMDKRSRPIAPHRTLGEATIGFCGSFPSSNRPTKNVSPNLSAPGGDWINVDSLFDVQVKRIHEYKRQLLNVLHVDHAIQPYSPGAWRLPRTAYRHFRRQSGAGLRHGQAHHQTHQRYCGHRQQRSRRRDQLKVVFIPNYNVSVAEIIIPACELSEQISTAGTEASGTSNMKFALNGALTIGTLDGANMEIHDEVGKENIFIFGLTANEVAERHAHGYNPWDYYHTDQELRRALEMIATGYFSPEAPDLHKPIINRLTHGGDPYLLLADYASYISCQEGVADLYLNRDEWTRKAILNVAHMGKFSSDRTIREYAEEIWGVKPVMIKLPTP